MTRAMSHRANGERLVDLALNAIEIIDRNLYERSCDVRWWAPTPPSSNAPSRLMRIRRPTPESASP